MMKIVTTNERREHLRNRIRQENPIPAALQAVGANDAIFDSAVQIQPEDVIEHGPLLSFTRAAAVFTGATYKDLLEEHVSNIEKLGSNYYSMSVGGKLRKADGTACGASPALRALASPAPTGLGHGAG